MVGAILSVAIPAFVVGVGIGILFARYLLKRNLKSHGIELK